MMLVSFGFFDVPEMAILLVIALVIFGPGKLPDIGKSLGKGIAEFKKASEGKTTEKKEDDQNNQNNKQ